MAAFHLGCGLVHARLRSHIDLNEFDGKALGSKVRHGLLSTFAVAGTHQHEDAFGSELPGDFPSDSFVCAGDECNRFSHRVDRIAILRALIITNADDVAASIICSSAVHLRLICLVE